MSEINLRKCIPLGSVTERQPDSFAGRPHLPCLTSCPTKRAYFQRTPTSVATHVRPEVASFTHAAYPRDGYATFEGGRAPPSSRP